MIYGNLLVVQLPKRRLMIATQAMHLTGDLSSPEPDLCIISGETDAYFVGMWLIGLGFADVQFSKETTRSLTSEEIIELRNDGPRFKGPMGGPFNPLDYCDT